MTSSPTSSSDAVPQNQLIRLYIYIVCTSNSEDILHAVPGPITLVEKSAIVD